MSVAESYGYPLDFFTNINRYKLAHMNKVAIHMSENAYRFGVTKEEAYITGFLHDIGYIKGRYGHEQHGYDLLKAMGLSENICEAIRYHGTDPYTLPKEKITPLLLCLYDGDMSVDKEGKDVGFRKRLADISDRYGQDSVAYETASNTVKYIKEYEKSKKKNIEIEK